MINRVCTCSMFTYYLNSNQFPTFIWYQCFKILFTNFKLTKWHHLKQIFYKNPLWNTGKGHFAVVKTAKHVFTGERVAVKVIDKTKIDAASKQHLLQEVRCMKLVQHPHIVRLYEVIDTQTRLFLVLELGDYDMFDYIMKQVKIPCPLFFQCEIEIVFASGIFFLFFYVTLIITTQIEDIYMIDYLLILLWYSRFFIFSWWNMWYLCGNLFCFICVFLYLCIC